MSGKRAYRNPSRSVGSVLTGEQLSQTGTLTMKGQELTLKHGDVVIAAITSCTNTSNPSVMLAAGLVAKKAVEAGLTVKPLRQNFARTRFKGRHRIPE